ncbi:MAG: hypothetical protein ACOCUS_05330 [Polyangiales bacterium]
MGVMRRVATRWTVVLGLAAAAALQVAGTAWDLGGCHPGETLTAEHEPGSGGCCDRKKTDRLTELGGDCCDPQFLTEEEPAASSGGTQVPVAPSAWLPVERSLLAVAPAAERAESAWRRSWSLPPPLAPPTENIVLLN